MAMHKPLIVALLALMIATSAEARSMQRGRQLKAAVDFSNLIGGRNQQGSNSQGTSTATSTDTTTQTPTNGNSGNNGNSQQAQQDTQTAATPPSPPSGLSLAEKDNTISVSFTAQSGLTYTAEAVAPNSAVGRPNNPKASGSSSPITITGLTPATAYTVYLTAKDNESGLTSSPATAQLTFKGPSASSSSSAPPPKTETASDGQGNTRQASLVQNQTPTDTQDNEETNDKPATNDNSNSNASGNANTEEDSKDTNQTTPPTTETTTSVDATANSNASVKVNQNIVDKVQELKDNELLKDQGATVNTEEADKISAACEESVDKGAQYVKDAFFKGTSVATSAASVANAIVSGKGTAFASAYAKAATDLISGGSKEKAISCVTSVAIAISISINEGKKEEASACADAFAKALFVEYECNVVIIEVVKVFISIVSTTFVKSGTIVVLG